MGNGSYTPILGSTRIYYFLKALNGTKPVVAFPQGLRMLAGGPSDSRPATYPPRGQLSYDQLQAMDPRVRLPPDMRAPKTDYFFRLRLSSGVARPVRFKARVMEVILTDSAHTSPMTLPMGVVC